MRTIEISTAVFAKIWSHRQLGEETENEILERLLGVNNDHSRTTTIGFAKTLWRHDVRDALKALGGEADLKEIYDKVRDIRRRAGRSLPVNTNPIIRRELEANCKESEAYTGKFDWFRPVNGIGGGRWSILDRDK